MMYKTQKPGYVIPLTLSIIALSITIVSYIYIRSAVYVPYMSLMAKREQAKMLALGGVNIALSEILQKNKGSQKEDPAKQLVKNILPALNRVQTFTFKQETDGISGEIQITITCEAGKIPINDVYDFETQKFIELESGGGQNIVVPPGGVKADKKSWKDLLQELFKRIEAQTGGKKLFEAFEKFLKTRQYKVNDVSELLTIKEFDVFKHSVWYEAPQQKKERRGEKQRPLYLQDLFTVTNSKKINPWFFSDSLLGVLDLPRAQAGQIKNRDKEVSKWVQSFNPTQNWKTEWEKQLKPIYGSDLQNLPKGIEMIFDNQTVPSYFSVIAQGTVDEVVQKVVAIIVTDKAATSIYRIYWL